MLKPLSKSSLVLREETDEWAILFDPTSGDAFGLDPVGVFIWKRLDGEHTLDDIVSEMRRSFVQIPKDAKEHVLDFIKMLHENELVL